ncbi:MAG: response regulator [Aeromicrobium sp.]
MATEPIKVVIVDDIVETRDHLSKLLGFENDIVVTGSVGSGEEALRLADENPTDVILLDINMPGMDGIATAEQLSVRAPTASLIMMSVQGEPDYLRRAMLAGAREFLVKPFSSDELSASIRQVHQRERRKFDGVAPATPAPTNGHAEPQRRGPGQVITFFAPKGGVGRTTLAVNFAVAAGLELNKKVVLVDGAFQFGDVGVLLNLNPRSKSIADLIPELDAGELDSIDTFLIDHSAGIRVLLAPPSPEMAELITPAGVKRVIEILRQRNELVVVDCAAWFNDTTLGILDLADIVLTVLTLEITSIRNTRLFLEAAEQLGYAHKVRLVLNRADTTLGIRVADVEHSIGRKVDHTIVSDGRAVVYALNRGVPFVLSNRESQVSQDVFRLAASIVGSPEPVEEAAHKVPQKGKSLFAWR